MNSALPGLHAILAGAWIGTVLVEALFERALLGQGRDKELLLARLHWKVDKWVELPLLIAVVVSGTRLLRDMPMDGLLRAKLACAALAVFANLYCIVLVRIRLRMAEAGQWALFEMVDKRQHLFGAVVLIGLLGAAGLGLQH
ncbi:hypothetical protein [Novosphingobium sp. B 225]|uniref:hypothetical protein n=1 Tax=Novosphingobium sp. B 225 TaxID=1961849 RepID=UPI000B4A8C7B|nr:hypothetical protein [Novosphingobium sp. B 225]